MGQADANIIQDILTDVKAQGNVLPTEQGDHYTKRYRALLKQTEKECPAPDEARNLGQRGRVKRSKAQKLTRTPSPL